MTYLRSFSGFSHKEKSKGRIDDFIFFRFTTLGSDYTCTLIRLLFIGLKLQNTTLRFPTSGVPLRNPEQFLSSVKEYEKESKQHFLSSESL
jgi:hypothetical protein